MLIPRAALPTQHQRNCWQPAMEEVGGKTSNPNRDAPDAVWASEGAMKMAAHAGFEPAISH